MTDDLKKRQTTEKRTVDDGNVIEEKTEIETEE
jgi:hypothetical protein